MEEDIALGEMNGFGDDLKEVRRRRRLTQQHLAQGAGYSQTYVSKVEGGTVFPSEKFAQKCDLVFDTHPLLERLRRRIAESDHPSWFVPYVQLEEKAAAILDYSTTLVMGLLQTEEYARTVFRAANPRAQQDMIEGKVAARMRRHEALTREDPPELWAMMHEATLRTVVGGNSLMADQLQHLLDLSAHAHVTLQVLPFSAGAPDDVTRPFTLLQFEDSPPVLYSDGPRGGRIFDDTGVVTKAQKTYDRLRAHAWPPAKSGTFMNTLLKEQYR
ncbi:helix-turn-helix domain-containing protein [Streptomyces sp. MS19]|uniref:helix-turn-helix domain-containing protein n=1 Tax=Streptomyces sp. MS19 TaxID=3385972 RepID=UPI00399F32A5